MPRYQIELGRWSAAGRAPAVVVDRKRNTRRHFRSAVAATAHVLRCGAREVAVEAFDPAAALDLDNLAEAWRMARAAEEGSN